MPAPTAPMFYLYHFNFSCDDQILPLFVTVAMLSRYQFPVNCSSRNVEANFAQKVHYRYFCHIQAWNLYSYLNETACLYKVEEMVQFSK
jgi:hypothetical protein